MKKARVLLVQERADSWVNNVRSTRQKRTAATVDTSSNARLRLLRIRASVRVQNVVVGPVSTWPIQTLSVAQQHHFVVGRLVG